MSGRGLDRGWRCDSRFRLFRIVIYWTGRRWQTRLFRQIVFIQVHGFRGWFGHGRRLWILILVRCGHLRDGFGYDIAT